MTIVPLIITIYLLVSVVVGVWSIADYASNKSIFIGFWWPLLFIKELYKAFKQVWE